MPDTPPREMPMSLGPVEVPPERLDLIRQHMRILSETARVVGDRLPLEASAADMIAVLESRRGRRS